MRQDFKNSRLAVCHSPSLSCSRGAAMTLPVTNPSAASGSSVHPSFQPPHFIPFFSSYCSDFILYVLLSSHLISPHRHKMARGAPGGSEEEAGWEKKQNFEHVWAQLNVLTQPRRTSSHSFWSLSLGFQQHKNLCSGVSVRAAELQTSAMYTFNLHTELI